MSQKQWIRITSIDADEDNLFVTVKASNPFVSINSEDIILNEYEDHYKGTIITKQTISVKAIVYDEDGEVSNFASVGLWDKEYGWVSAKARGHIRRYRQEHTDIIPGLKCPECGSDVCQVYSSLIQLAPSDNTNPLYLKRLSCSKCDWEHIFETLRLERSYKFLSNYARNMVNSMEGYL